MLIEISIIGLGKLGLPIAACLASREFKVIGVDSDPSKLNGIRQRIPTIFEPGLGELLVKAGKNLTVTDDINAAVTATKVTFILVPTPSEPGGAFSLSYVLPVCGAIGRALRGKSERHIVVLTSTVMPGSTGGVVRAALEKASGKRVGLDFGLCYNPEFVALGSVVRDFLAPDLVLIGESDSSSGEALAGLYQNVCRNGPSVARMNFVSAEIAKLALNTFVTTKITFANMLARICEKLPEASVERVAQALGLDQRIGPRCLAGAVSYGGPCFPRDNVALATLARSLGVPADVPEATDRVNRWHAGWLADRIETELDGDSTVAVLGLTYKPNTDIVEESFGLAVARELTRRGRRVLAYDPAINSHVPSAAGATIRITSNANECIQLADVAVLATPWPEFQRIPAEVWSRHSAPRTVIDCWRALRHLDGQAGVLYIPLGMGGSVGERKAVAVS